MLNKQSCGACNEYEKHQMLCSFAPLLVTGVWLVQHFSSGSASVSSLASWKFPPLCSNALHTIEPHHFSNFVSESLQFFLVNVASQGC